VLRARLGKETLATGVATRVVMPGELAPYRPLAGFSFPQPPCSNSINRLSTSVSVHSSAIQTFQPSNSLSPSHRAPRVRGRKIPLSLVLALARKASPMVILRATRVHLADLGGTGWLSAFTLVCTACICLARTHRARKRCDFSCQTRRALPQR
jgi:hypothetical protein